ncbi:MAG: ribosome recycling factor [Actinobacteria bacterium]|nr:ribosome recycling factor [Actinomycetota bacterium]
MQKAVVHARSEFGTVRTGRASPALVERLPVHAYGQDMPLVQLAGFQVPEARQLLITPYDRANVGPIEKAILNSDLGLNPSNDGISIRLVFPQLTTERRKELVKRVKQMAEDGKIAIRGVRQRTRKELDALEKAGSMSADEVTRAEKELDKLTHAAEAEVEKSFTEKEQELLEV